MSMFEQAFKNIDDVLWKEAGYTTELDYTEQTSWLLFLKYLDDLEQDKATEAALDGKKYTDFLDKPYRWESWAAPKGKDGKLDHNKALTGDDLRDLATQSAKMEILHETINIGFAQWIQRRSRQDDTFTVHESSPQIPGRNRFAPSQG